MPEHFFDLGQPTLALQAMTLDDVPTVSTMEQVVFTSPWSAHTFRYEVEQNHASRYYVLRYLPWLFKHATTLRSTLRRVFSLQEVDRSLLGYGGFWFVIDEAHITTLALCEAWRGQGLGELLLLGLVEQARVRGACIITLEVRASNLVAQQLYQKYGFIQVGLRKRYYTDNREDAYLMTAHEVDSPVYAARLEALHQALAERLAAHPPQPPISVASPVD